MAEFEAAVTAIVAVAANLIRSEVFKPERNGVER
jgi:hypothetical protein